MASEEEFEKEDEDNEVEAMRNISRRVRSIDHRVEDIKDLLERHLDDDGYEPDYSFHELKDFYESENGY